MSLKNLKLFFVVLISFLLFNPSLAQDDFLDPEEAFVFSAAMATPSRLDIHFQVAPQYYMYKDRLDFEIKLNQAEGSNDEFIEKVVLPDGLVKYDVTFEQDLEVYYGNYTLQLHLKPDAADNFDVVVTSQGCAEIGLCYSPSQHLINIKNTESGYVASGNGVESSVPDISQSTPASQYAKFQEPDTQSDSGLDSGLSFLNNKNADNSSASNNSVDINSAAALLSSNSQNSNKSSSSNISANDNAKNNASTDATSANKLANNNNLNLDGLMQASDVGIAQYIQNAGLIKVIIIAFVLGMLLSFTPCVLPMVPILLAVLTGSNSQESQSGPRHKNKSNNQNLNAESAKQDTSANQANSTADKPVLTRGKGFALAAVFVLGMSIVYTAMGVGAGVLGASLAAWLQKPLVLVSFAVLLFVFALAMFDAITIQVPSSMQSRLNNVMNNIPGGRYSGVFTMGMLSALIVGPCVAAPLAGVLLFISQTGDLVLGAAALFALAWGQGVLLLVVGASSGVLMLKAGTWMQSIKYVFGMLLLATAWWMVQSVFAPIVIIIGWAFIILFAALLIWNIAKNLDQNSQLLKSFWQTISVLMALWSALIIIGAAMGFNSIMQPLQGLNTSNLVLNNNQNTGQASSETSKPVFAKVESLEELNLAVQQSDKPLLLDFYADWCVSCIQMEKFTFSDQQVASLMQKFTLLQADVTDNTAAHQQLLKEFNLYGPPGIMFYDSNGEYLGDTRVIGYKNAQQFTKILNQVLNNS